MALERDAGGAWYASRGGGQCLARRFRTARTASHGQSRGADDSHKPVVRGARRSRSRMRSARYAISAGRVGAGERVKAGQQRRSEGGGRGEQGGEVYSSALLYLYPPLAPCPALLTVTSGRRGLITLGGRRLLRPLARPSRRPTAASRSGHLVFPVLSSTLGTRARGGETRADWSSSWAPAAARHLVLLERGEASSQPMQTV